MPVDVSSPLEVVPQDEVSPEIALSIDDLTKVEAFSSMYCRAYYLEYAPQGSV